jgi:hypothetical protein
MFTIIGAMAERESSLISERVTDYGKDSLHEFTHARLTGG